MSDSGHLSATLALQRAAALLGILGTMLLSSREHCERRVVTSEVGWVETHRLWFAYHVCMFLCERSTGWALVSLVSGGLFNKAGIEYALD